MAASGRSTTRAAVPGTVVRFLLFLLLWGILIGPAPANLVAGLPAAALACWVSLWLLPPFGQTLSLSALLAVLVRLPGQSLIAGLDVARRALSPAMPLRPGIVAYRTDIPPGLERDAFRALMSLQPGTLPVGEDADGALLIHCLDVDQPVTHQLALEEARFRRGTGKGSHG
ncbi:Na+/H+ antiporter subunit E [Tabrizicola sp. J26]|uniref:Na+/H+ antiporter subunit E n=1 Tax=Alitabrizicola rongguiensis TaxID=2909234 RepID=UPI001F3A94A2|nr:Na+/H+ antiporter subunit E [Tabrizicola rongguiensis]MCF1710890.1 Na+/H+ antiporter subunit E [Tabrizicola rongguiensis]